MNMEAIKKSLQKLQQLGYFKVTEEPDFQVRREEKKVDLTVKGTETSKNEIQFGAGYSALDGFFGQFSFQTRNFLGRGEVLGASAQLGRISDYYDLSYTIPWFMDRNQTIGASRSTSAPWTTRSSTSTSGARAATSSTGGASASSTAGR